MNIRESDDLLVVAPIDFMATAWPMRPAKLCSERTLDATGGERQVRDQEKGENSVR